MRPLPSNMAAGEASGTFPACEGVQCMRPLPSNMAAVEAPGTFPPSEGVQCMRPLPCPGNFPPLVKGGQGGWAR
jgi:hypothetical protein